LKRNLVVTPHGDIGAQFPEEMDEIVGKAVVIIDDEGLGHSGPASSKHGSGGVVQNQPRHRNISVDLILSLSKDEVVAASAQAPSWFVRLTMRSPRKLLIVPLRPRRHSVMLPRRR